MKILARLAKEIRAGRSRQTYAQTLKTHAFFKMSLTFFSCLKASAHKTLKVCSKRKLFNKGYQAIELIIY